MLKSRQAKAMTLAGLMGVAGLMTGCPGPTDSTPPTTCDCTGDQKDLAFGETCGCGADICDCKVKEYGKINGIPVYRENGVTDIQAVTGYSNLVIAYNAHIVGENNKDRIDETNLNGFILTVDGWPNREADKMAGIKYAKIKHDAIDMIGDLAVIDNAYLPIISLYNNAKNTVRMGGRIGAWHQICLV